ncbi:hypothetical protein D6856_04255 [Butyrivibrio sp. XB500-5]|nr:hypothetical protein D6856_04255 [Butyrivibrio sp. XB500-5]
MTGEERLSELHRRMKGLRKKRQSRMINAMGMVSTALFACLFIIIQHLGVGQFGTTTNLYSGSSLLYEEAGGYVLTAIVAFVVGTIVTVICVRKHNRDKENGEES